MDPKLIKRTIKKESTTSTHLQTEKKILISLPPEFEETATYPTLFLHDGDDYFNFGRIVTQANRLIYEKKINPLLMVAVPVDKTYRSAEYSPIGSRHSAHINFMTEELLPFISDRYPIDQNFLVVGGSSLGATASLHLAMHDPSIWNKVLAQSGFFFPETITNLEKHAPLDWLTIYQSVGLKETDVDTHLGQVNLVTRNHEVRQKFEENGANLHYIEQDGDHTWGLWQPQLPEALTFFFGK